MSGLLDPTCAVNPLRSQRPYNLYLGYLEVIEPERKLYLAVDHRTYEEFFQQKAIQFVVNRYSVALLVVDVLKEEVVQWRK
jgi:hypothetical protein